MTLNITVATEKRIYQCADYRITDLVTGKPEDLPHQQKIFFAYANTWTATVCFNGLGRTSTKLEVSSWLNDVCIAAMRTREESLDDFLSQLQTADSWLSQESRQDRRHSFLVAAFVGRAPIISLVSNYERFDRVPAAVARNQLAIEKEFPRAPRTFVSGQYRDVDEPRRQELAALAAETNDIDKVFDALVQTNRDVASSNNKVSSSCFTTCLSRTGDGVGKPYDMIIPADLDLFRGGSDVRRPGPDLRGKSLKGYVFANVGRTSEAEYHSIHLEDKPDAPGTHINYGVFLEKGGDIDGSERAFRKALSVDPLNVTALANLANVLDRAGSSDEADALFRQTLEISPGLEYASYRYANFLWRKGTDSARIRGIIEEGIRLNPQSGRLLLLLGNIEMRESRGKPALAAFQRARELGAEQAAVETGCAFALHISGAPIADCIAAYRTAIALDSMNAALTLNMAQLLFAAGLDDQAQPTLRRAMRLELDPPSQLEAQFYLLAHMQADPVSAVSKMRGLLQAGARLTWSMDVTLERVNAINPNRAKLLKQLRGVLAGNEPVSKLAVLAPQLSSML